MNKLVGLLAALLCMGMLCACGDSTEIHEAEINNTTSVAPEDFTSCESDNVTSYVPRQSYPDIQFNFSFVWQGDYYYLIFNVY